MRLFNTQSQSIEQFEVINGRVGIYTCGITPYDTTHAGHAFLFLTFDVLVRYLRDRGHDVTYVQNVTDIDDDILRKAAELGVPWDDLGRRETAKYRTDMRNLNALDPDHYVAVTAHINEIVALISQLVDRGVAYEVNGSVYYAVDKDPDFGKLSHIPRGGMLAVANERGNKPDDPNKRDPLDFVLWQAGAPGEPTWDSPWSKGRPGWHIECSAMSMAYLGNTVDIHGGGYDLIFPHHECEIAQSEIATGVKPFARYWMHVAMVKYQGEKMSKSLGNLVLVSDVLKDSSADAFRLYLLSNHYRTEWEYEDDTIDQWASVANDLREAAEFPAYGVEDILDMSRQRQRFYDALDNDLDTPQAITVLHEIAQAILEAPEEDDIRQAQDTLRALSDVLGLDLQGSR
ncbi:MAG: Cysteinyl-tRNA synthetase [uncultured Thermomicrobiales bacterium]|uniref:Cysteine--tRNA ligase n=1 Tax=uncultured Thermomicrobiales bacterium TaxID=1645740 RepID=A0A6J4UU35_9BACT|nr:MAG: Cysteinyl-tRNA synthetase [uncultured Thermomicrobiales bacterium]